MAARAGADVLVVGAGIGGASIALALARAGLEVVLLERHAGPGNVNRGNSLLPVVTRHLSRWGALGPLREAGARPIRAMEVHHHRLGLLMEAPLPWQGDEAPYVMLRHQEIERVMVETAAATGRVEVRYSTRATGLLRDGDRVCGVRAAGPDDRPLVVEARLVVGADGGRSVVRRELGIEAEPEPYEHAYFGIEFARPPGYRDAMRLELHPRGGVLVTPEGEDRIGLGVLVRPGDLELFRAGSFEAKVAAVRERSALLAGPEPVPGSAHLYPLVRAHASRYHAAGAVLLGDAVHMTNPTAGQGMTMAIEDAEALARHVAPVLAAGDPPPVALDAALAAYEGERLPRNASSIRWSHALARVYAAPGRLGDWVRRGVCALGRCGSGQALQRWIWSRVAVRAGA